MWQVLRNYFGDPFGDEPQEKIAFLKRHRLAMWDVLSYADLKGSGDADLKVSQPTQLSDVAGLLQRSQIDAIFCNGKKSYELLQKYFRLNVPTVLLPSTSPANVAFRQEDWFKAFKNYEKEKGQCL